MESPKTLPTDPESRDLQALRGRIRNFGSLDSDPPQSPDGWTWFREDLSPPELRVRLGGDLYSVELSPVT